MARRAQTESPDSIQVDDAMREWAAEKWGLQFLPDVYITDWQDAARARGSLYADARQALQNWIRWSAPGGRFHRVHEWEQKCKAAKARENGQIKRTSRKPETVAGQPIDDYSPTRPSSEVARAALASIKGMIR